MGCVKGSTKLDLGELERLCELGLPIVDIAYVLGCNRDTIYQFPAIVEKGRANRRKKLRQWMWEVAGDKNVAMLIFLSKQYLGYTDKVSQEVATTAEATKKLSNEDLVGLSEGSKNRSVEAGDSSPLVS